MKTSEPDESYRYQPATASIALKGSKGDTDAANAGLERRHGPGQNPKFPHRLSWKPATTLPYQPRGQLRRDKDKAQVPGQTNYGTQRLNICSTICPETFYRGSGSIVDNNKYDLELA